jgi:hypothetical protein
MFSFTKPMAAQPEVSLLFTFMSLKVRYFIFLRIDLRP